MSDPIISTSFNPFLKQKGFMNIKELKNIKKISDNAGFSDAAFESMMRQVGWKSGEHWCAYFVKLIYMQFYSFDRDWLSLYFTGSARGNFDMVVDRNRRGDKRYVAVTQNPPQVGDIAVWGVRGNGHTAIITEIIDPNKEIKGKKVPIVKTIEGNTNSAGSRTGDRVDELTRGMAFGGKEMPLIGYIRRNFTEAELRRLQFDDSKQTLVYSDNIISKPTTASSNKNTQTQQPTKSSGLGGFFTFKTNI